MHPSITSERVMSAVRESMFDLANPGFCINCGADADGCEPDMRRGKCDSCNTYKVYGAEELLIYI
jgi:hypothetical protein